MAFAMKMRFVDVITDGSLKNRYANGEKVGYQFDIRLGYYRGHFLSTIDRFEVTVDDEPILPQDLRFCINGKEFAPTELKDCVTEFWQLTSPAQVKVIKQGGLPAGKHTIKVELMLRVPYMQIGPGHQFMPLDSGQEKTIELID
ncbi:hypothetical protein A5867_000865 [Enterococcus sp. 6D12_DIV0197]|uniref:C-glycoside deglycosidase beta subunit domain-containing protein n=1 Tax=Enterococcus sp. 6D12_DIV0197 TaxID=1834184 RepID=UPI000B3EB10F|nr:DUF6379 domain-containing protein [Enterococcus sp. 6D12_DIV0197]OUZ23182.1 hypothetical protein A5867_000865 [Enterococcus sp. 6D12_DIV0197]